ncbi:MAG: response regulator [Verrucomicrobia bacterium]|nr:response regulator [Verrucomicrobiota bacterium]
MQDRQDRILVIDDELGPRESLRFLFKDEYDVVCCDSVDVGVAELKREAPDVIIMDIKMPGKTGIEGLQEIRKIDTDISVVMLTGFGSLETAQEAIRHGANDYVKKPFDMQEMRSIVRKYVDRTRVARGRLGAFGELEELNKQLQSELVDKEHLAQLGQASSEFVHDLRNPLSVICGYVQLLMDQLQETSSFDGLQTDTAREYLARVEKSVFRCQEMAKMWKSLGQKDEMRMTPCSVMEIVEEVSETASAIASDVGGRVDLVRGPADCVVRGDSLQIFRAVQNLVSNAIQAFPDQGGVVKLGWDCSDDWVAIEVRDNGCGIPEDKLETIFNPYFTTKEGSGGMGIGLFITKKVIENHAGSISIVNDPSGGAVARVEFPRMRVAQQ